MAGPHEPLTPEARASSALMRLAASRARLRQALLPPHDDAPGVFDHDAWLPRRLRALWRALRRKLHGAPLAGMTLGAVESWWQHQPWREPTMAIADELRSAALPLVRRHPVACVVAAAGVGAALAAFPPWRWSFLRRRVRALPRWAGRSLLAQLSQPSTQAMIAGVLMAALGRANARADAREEARDVAREQAREEVREEAREEVRAQARGAAAGNPHDDPPAATAQPAPAPPRTVPDVPVVHDAVRADAADPALSASSDSQTRPAPIRATDPAT